MTGRGLCRPEEAYAPDVPVRHDWIRREGRFGHSDVGGSAPRRRSRVTVYVDGAYVGEKGYLKLSADRFVAPQVYGENKKPETRAGNAISKS